MGGGNYSDTTYNHAQQSRRSQGIDDFQYLRMNAEKFAALLESLDACTEARLWAKGKSFAEVWESCERGDWLLWLCARMIGKPGWPTHQEVVLSACDCAVLALHLVKSGEDRPRIAIETARKWARGGASLSEVKDAADDAAEVWVEAGDAWGTRTGAAAAYSAAVTAYSATGAYIAAYGAPLKRCAERVRTRLHPDMSCESA